MENRPQHYDLINLVKHIICIKNQKDPALLGGVSAPNRLNYAYCPIDYCFQPRANMVILACVGGIRSRDLQHALSKKLAPHLPDAHLAYSV